MIPRSQRGFPPRPRPVLSLAAAAGGLLLAAASPVAAQVAPQPSSVAPGLLADQPQEGAANPSADTVVVTATRLPVDEDASPAAITVISAEELAERQTDRVADALRAVPGISVSQSGAPGQLTSVFTRGLNSDQTQVLIDGIPFNQGLAGEFDFADLTGDGIERIEVERGPQSTLYGPRAAAGTIQLFTRRGDGLDPAHPFTFDVSAEGGSFGTYRERAAVAGVIGAPVPAAPAPASDAKDGKGDGTAPAPAAAAPSNGPGVFDYSLAFSRLDTNNERENNEYRNTAVVANFGFAPRALTLDTFGGSAPRLGVLILYSYSDASSPDTIFTPQPLDNLLTERQLYAPNIDWQLTKWWHHRLVLEYDKERQVNNPNNADPFTGPTRSTFFRYQLDYQNDVAFTHWLTLTSGVFYENVLVNQLRPDVSQAFGPEAVYLKDFTDNEAVFAQVSLTPFRNLLFVAGGRYDHFNLFGDVGTYRVAASYLFPQTGTTIRSSVATGFSPPDPQDRIFSSGDLSALKAANTFGYDAGFEQGLFKNRLRFGANYFHNDLSNVIGFNSVTFATLNLGAARTEGAESFVQWEPVIGLLIRGTYTYLDAVNTAGGDYGNLAPGARLPRRPRNEAFLSVGYRWPGPLSRLSTILEAKIVNGREDVTFNAAGNAQNFNLPDYTVLRLVASYAVSEHFSVFGRIENLTNADYQEVYGYPALPRGYFGGVTVHY